MAETMSGATFEPVTTIVRAGAGAGKTTQLVSNVLSMALHFKEQHKKWPRLVVTTFTRKATQELRQRLVIRATELGNWDLLQFVSSKSFLQISTIHGVLGSLLRRYGHLIDVDPQFEILSREESSYCRKVVARPLIFADGSNEPLIDIMGVSPLVEAMAQFSFRHGSGLQLLPMAEDDLRRDLHTLLVNVTSDYFKTCELISAETDQPKWTAFLQDQLAQREALRRGQLINREMLFADRLPSFAKKNPPFSEELKELFSEQREQLKKELLRVSYQPDEWQQAIELQPSFHQLALQFSEAWNGYKREKGYLEMEELEWTSLQLVRSNSPVISAFSSEVDFWLIDEFQDTSPLQIDILRSLIGQSPAYFVGDPQQSIYLFRGARSEIFSQTEERIQKAHGKTEKLVKNYRSDPELLCFFNDFFASVSDHFMQMQPREQPNTQPQGGSPQVVQPSVATFISHLSDKDENDNADEADDKKSSTQLELSSILNYVQSLLQQGVSPGQICILTKKNSQALQLARFLSEHHLPTQLHAKSGFNARREILDLTSIASFIANPHDNKNLVAVLRSPWFYLPDEDLALLVSSKKSFSYWSLLDEQKESHQSVMRLKELLSRASHKGAYLTLKEMVIEVGMVDFSHHHDPTGRREANIWKWLWQLREAERQSGFHWHEFLRRVSIKTNASVKTVAEEGSESDSDAIAATEPDRIQLMTVHASKGLQFDHVILPSCHRPADLSQGKAFSEPFYIDEQTGKYSVLLATGDDNRSFEPPALRNHILQLSQRELQEQDRLLYVALTRAKKTICMTWTGGPHPTSWLGRCQFPLEMGEHERDNYKYTVYQGYPEDIAERKEVESLMTVRAPWHDSKDPTVGSPTYSSVTELLQEHSSRSLSIDAVMNLSQASDFGVKLHRVLELKSKGYTADIDRYFDHLSSERAAEIQSALKFVESLQMPPMLRLMQEGYPEWGFQTRHQDGLLDGQIDLWGIIDDVCWVVDYKSGSSRYVEKAFAQLGIYAKALSPVINASQVQLAVIYPLEKKAIIREYK